MENKCSVIGCEEESRHKFKLYSHYGEGFLCDKHDRELYLHGETKFLKKYIVKNTQLSDFAKAKD